MAGKGPFVALEFRTNLKLTYQRHKYRLLIFLKNKDKNIIKYIIRISYDQECLLSLCRVFFPVCPLSHHQGNSALS